MSFTRTVYLVEHLHIQESGEEDVKVIGIYSSRDRAAKAVSRAKKLAGFNLVPDGFSISAYSLNEDRWDEGYITILHPASSENSEEGEKG